MRVESDTLVQSESHTIGNVCYQPIISRGRRGLGGNDSVASHVVLSNQLWCVVDTAKLSFRSDRRGSSLYTSYASGSFSAAGSTLRTKLECSQLFFLQAYICVNNRLCFSG
ncbi:hypothetical protein KOW79_005176 [Hemibagrus wyckioides]|uniref:Uncharacterized protein n=1 Tax=Hemibagrus wyckioides TaxID=337641 RepID=A0A9D3SP11_9TELE|nr:hypothetical protein KOW79_005176 [Hemibagrus wyckioides]